MELATLSMIMTGVQTAVTLFGDDGSKAAANEAAETGAINNTLLRDQAAVDRTNAIQGQAESQRAAREELYTGELMRSRAQAQGGASGSGVFGGGGIEGELAAIGARAEHNAMSALYNGNVAAQDLEHQANMREWEGGEYLRGGIVESDRIKHTAKKKQVNSLLSQGGKFAGSFGGGKEPYTKKVAKGSGKLYSGRGRTA